MSLKARALAACSLVLVALLASATPASAALLPDATSSAGEDCQVSTNMSVWSSGDAAGFIVMATVINTGSTLLDDWTVAYEFSERIRIVRESNAEVSTDGFTVTARDLETQPPLAQGEHVRFSFSGRFGWRFGIPEEPHPGGPTNVSVVLLGCEPT